MNATEMKQMRIISHQKYIIQRYADHKDDCNKLALMKMIDMKTRKPECTCGFDNTMKRLKEKVKGWVS